jgi:hypothetical protein
VSRLVLFFSDVGMFDGLARVFVLNWVVLSDTDVNYRKFDLTTAN